MDSQLSFEGKFGFDSFICTLFPQDPNKFYSDNSVKSLLLSLKEGQDPKIFPLSIQLDDKSKAKLFHEQIHLWQILNSSILHYHFINFLGFIESSLEKLNFKDIKVAQVSPLFFKDTDLSSAMGLNVFSDSLTVLDVTFSWNLNNLLLTQSKELQNTFSIYPYSAMPFMYLPCNVKLPYPGIPSFGGELLINGTVDVLFPFSGIALLETASLIYECLFENKSFPVEADIQNDNTLKYIGPWIFWKRLHKATFLKERDAAIAFLAAVDISFKTDVLDHIPAKIAGEFNYYESERVKHSKVLDDINKLFKDSGLSATHKSERYMEKISIPYNFGKTAFRFRKYSGFSFENKSIVEAINKIQEDYHLDFSQTNIYLMLKINALFLTKLILISIKKHTPGLTLNNLDLENDIYKINFFYESWVRTFELVDDYKHYYPLWNELSQYINSFIGGNLIAYLINACIFSIENPGIFCYPYENLEILKTNFPLPLININGIYFNENIGKKNSRGPIAISPKDLTKDCINLNTLKGLRLLYDNTNFEKLNSAPNFCGFRNENNMCCFKAIRITCLYDDKDYNKDELMENRTLCVYQKLTIG
jgi:hypothetical protein